MSAWPAVLTALQVLGWALWHFVWQAALIGAGYALLRRCVPRGEPRYLLGMLTLIVLALCPLLTVWRISAAMSGVSDTRVGPVAAVFGDASQVAPQTSSGWQFALAAAMPWLVLIWACGVVFLSLRVWRHWRRLQALVRAAHALPVWQERLRELAQRFGLRRGVRVLSSARVATPTLVGWISPVIVLPIAVSCGFPVAQVEMILAHELAHLRRFDHLANLFQVILETLLFYHPVVHWISREVRNERELCCDALALRVTGGNRRALATALVELEEFREQHAGLTLAASGGVLLERVWQITGVERNVTKRAQGRFVGALSALLLVAILLSLLWRQAELRRELADSVTDMQHLLTSQLLPAAVRMPAQAIANLVPQHLAISPLQLQEMRAIAAITNDATSAPTAPQQKLTIATPALRIADLNPAHLALAPSITTLRAAVAPKMPDIPMPTHIEQPVYPPDAQQRGIEGKVVMEFSIDADGSVRAPVVVDAQPAITFDHAATHALLGWKFAVPSGAAADKRYRQTFTFTLQGDSNIAGKEIRAKAGCYAVTGTHICRTRNLDEAFATGAVQ